jgi:hypothetical protein
MAAAYCGGSSGRLRRANAWVTGSYAYARVRVKAVSTSSVSEGAVELFDKTARMSCRS